METTNPKPFLKWAGGKRNILPILKTHLPKSIPPCSVYYEPMVGGGALFFSVYDMFSHYVINDTNVDLMLAMKEVRDHVEEVIEALKVHVYDKDYYYTVRETDLITLNPAQRAARIIYLNRTCYNGLYRVNSKGKFNVPFGNYTNPVICNEKNLRAVSKLLSECELYHHDFWEIGSRATVGDFVYFDPPYHKVKNDSFVSYNTMKFEVKDHERLAELMRLLTKKGVMCLLSNSLTPFTEDIFKEFEIIKVNASRTINSNKMGRGKIADILVKNY